jgi:cation:H+ antiporter
VSPVLSALLVFALGAAALIAGADLLVRGAARLAAVLGLSALVIGLTVVSYGTSAPELAVSVASALRGDPDIALGNVVGSNIFNVLVILGISAAIAPLAVAHQLVRLDVPLMLLVSVLASALAYDGRLSRAEGVVLLLGAVAYTALAVSVGRRESAVVQAEYRAVEAALVGPPARSPRAIAGHGLMIVGGLALLVVGARWLVQSAVAVARELGVSELVIGLTIVAAGTSLPEVATSVVAAVRGERDIAVGNVVGSNIFNLLAVLGLATVVSPGGVGIAPPVLRVDLPVMIVVTAACLPVVASGRRIDRWEGALLLLGYCLYVTYLIGSARQHPALPAYEWGVTRIVLPTLLLAFALPVLLQRPPAREGETSEG